MIFGTGFPPFRGGLLKFADSEGLKKIVVIKASMNRSLPPKLKDAFPNTIPVVRPLVLDKGIKDTFDWYLKKLSE